jgi:cytochrome c5
VPNLLRPDAALFVLSLGVGACQRSEQPVPNPAPAKPAALKPAAEDPKDRASTLFRQRCTVCHGAEGRGDGPGAATLTPKPRAFSDAGWQATVTDEHLREIVVKGGAALELSPGMPSNPDLAGKPALVDELTMSRHFPRRAA